MCPSNHWFQSPVIFQDVHRAELKQLDCRLENLSAKVLNELVLDTVGPGPGGNEANEAMCLTTLHNSWEAFCDTSDCEQAYMRVVQQCRKMKPRCFARDELRLPKFLTAEDLVKAQRYDGWLARIGEGLENAMRHLKGVFDTVDEKEARGATNQLIDQHSCLLNLLWSREPGQDVCVCTVFAPLEKLRNSIRDRVVQLKVNEANNFLSWVFSKHELVEAKP